MASALLGACRSRASSCAPLSSSLLLLLCRRVGAPSPCSLAPSWSVAPLVVGVPVRHATSKAGGSTKNGRDSQPKFLGVKAFGGQYVEPGNIILRQRGQRFGIVESTQTVAFGKDWTIYALKAGYVKFWRHAMKKKSFVEVVTTRPPNNDNTPPPGAPPAPVGKYPISRLRAWEVPDLLALPPSTAVSEGILAQLVAYLRNVHPARLRAILPHDRPVVGDVQKIFWDADGRFLLEASAAAAEGAAAAVVEGAAAAEGKATPVKAAPRLAVAPGQAAAGAAGAGAGAAPPR